MQNYFTCIYNSHPIVFVLYNYLFIFQQLIIKHRFNNKINTSILNLLSYVRIRYILSISSCFAIKTRSKCTSAATSITWGQVHKTSTVTTHTRWKRVKATCSTCHTATLYRRYVHCTEVRNCCHEALSCLPVWLPVTLPAGGSNWRIFKLVVLQPLNSLQTDT